MTLFALHDLRLARGTEVFSFLFLSFCSGLAMGRSEIESWIASTASASGDDEDSSASGWRRENILKDWPGAMRAAQTMLFSSSTKARVQFLREELLVLAKHGGTLTSPTC